MSARTTFLHEVMPAAPTKLGSPLFHRQDVSDHSGLSAVAIRERVNLDQLVMKSDEGFVDRESGLVEPILSVAQELGQALGDFARIATDTDFVLAIDSGPFPYFAKHSLMEFSYV